MKQLFILATLLIAGASCLPTERAPTPTCLTNETFQEWGTNCEPTCDDINSCNKERRLNRCQCDQGFVRHAGKCIDVLHCPPCPENEEEKIMCSETYTDLTCKEPKRMSSGIFHVICGAKVCRCKEGFVRKSGTQKLSSGPCIAISDCPKRAFLCLFLGC